MLRICSGRSWGSSPFMVGEEEGGGKGVVGGWRDVGFAGGNIGFALGFGAGGYFCFQPLKREQRFEGGACIGFPLFRFCVGAANSLARSVGHPGSLMPRAFAAGSRCRRRPRLTSLLPSLPDHHLPHGLALSTRAHAHGSWELWQFSGISVDISDRLVLISLFRDTVASCCRVRDG